jgi:hypothetical protein
LPTRGGRLRGAQTLDAIDGKQARRTGSSSPLGQLFDHGTRSRSLPHAAHGGGDVTPDAPRWAGCDALCAMMSGLLVANMVQAGPTFYALGWLLIHIVPFYMSNWEECVDCSPALSPCRPPTARMRACAGAKRTTCASALSA